MSTDKYKYEKIKPNVVKDTQIKTITIKVDKVDKIDEFNWNTFGMIGYNEEAIKEQEIKKNMIKKINLI